MHFKTIIYTIAFGAAALVHSATAASEQNPKEAKHCDPPINPLCVIECSPLNYHPPLRCINGCCGFIA